MRCNCSNCANYKPKNLKRLKKPNFIYRDKDGNEAHTDQPLSREAQTEGGWSLSSAQNVSLSQLKKWSAL